MSRDQKQATLIVRNLVKAVHTGQEETFILEVPSFTVDECQIVGIVGKMNSGKSTLLDLLSMSTQPDTCDTFELVNRQKHEHPNVTTLGSARSEASLGGCRALIGYVPQSDGLIPFLNIWENAAVPSQTFGRPVPGARITSLSSRLGIVNKLAKLPRHLTASQRRNASILRGLAHRPALLLVDEVPAGIPPDEARTIMRILKDLVLEQSGSAIIAAHSPSQIAEVADRIYSFHKSSVGDGRNTRVVCTLTETTIPIGRHREKIPDLSYVS